MENEFNSEVETVASENEIVINDEAITNVLNGLSEVIGQEQVDLYLKLRGETAIKGITDNEEFYYSIIYPFDKYVSGLIKAEISTNSDAAFIIKNSQFIERHFHHLFEKVEGSACCADKARSIVNMLIRYYKDGIRIDFDYSQEYTYHLPKLILKTHESIIKFYESLRALYYGDGSKYITILSNILESSKNI